MLGGERETSRLELMNLDVTADVTLPRLTSSVRTRDRFATTALAALVLASLASAVTATGAL